MKIMALCEVLRCEMHCNRTNTGNRAFFMFGSIKIDGKIARKVELEKVSVIPRWS